MEFFFNEVRVKKIIDVKPIPKFENLEIIFIDKTSLIVPKNQFKKNDLCVYLKIFFEFDSKKHDKEFCIPISSLNEFGIFKIEENDLLIEKKQDYDSFFYIVEDADLRKLIF